MVNTAEIRFRRPKDHELLIQTLRDEAEFPTIRDVLLFAAALGHANGRREPFQSSGEPIRFEQMMAPTWAQPLVEMLATAGFPDDPEILSSKRLQDQVTVFEEYANGGLSYLQGQMNTRRESADVVCSSLVVDALADIDLGEGPSVDELVDELAW
jgi:dnd system-associated protein 4